MLHVLECSVLCSVLYKYRPTECFSVESYISVITFQDTYVRTFCLVNRSYYIGNKDCGFAMATTLGQVKEFNPDTDPFAAYVERMNIFFTINDIKADKRAAVFLNFIGGRAYELLRSLLTPTLPQTLKYDELVALLKEHYEPKPLVIAERFQFHRRNQHGESIAEYMAELRRLATHCEFKTYLNEALRDRLCAVYVTKACNDDYSPRKLQQAMEIS